MAAALRCRATTTKGEHELRERMLGYNISPYGMWNSDACLAVLPLEKFVNDSMHAYFANGIVGSEIDLLLQKIKEISGTTISQIREAVVSAAWERHSCHVRHGENRYWVKRLWTENFFGSGMYKGSAKQTLAIASLIRWMCDLVWSRNPALQEHARCFLLLCKCIDSIRSVAQTHRFDELDVVQRAHHVAFAATYPDFIRPKHHHRLHLPAQYATLHVVPTCWGTESKHRDYKGIFAKNMQQWLQERMGGLDFSIRLLPRLLLRHSELLEDRPMSHRGWVLEAAFSTADVQRETDLEDCVLAPKCRIGLLELQEKDILLWLTPANHYVAGIIHFFVDNKELFVYLTICNMIRQTESLITFEKSNERKMVKWKTMSYPRTCSWWKQSKDGCHIFCLP